MKDDNGFEVAADGFVQLSPLGEFLHKGAGVTQVIDARACELMADDFRRRARVENFPGLLVDFDHFSLDTDKPSEAAGWVTAMEARPDGGGLMMYGNKIYYEGGGLRIDLETGGVAKVDGRKKVGS